MSTKIKLNSFEKVQNRWMQDAKIRQAYEDLEPEYQISSSLIKARIKRNLIQVELAKLVGMKQPVISRIEAMSSLPSVATLKKISQALGEPLFIKFGSR